MGIWPKCCCNTDGCCTVIPVEGDAKGVKMLEEEVEDVLLLPLVLLVDEDVDAEEVFCS